MDSKTTITGWPKRILFIVLALGVLARAVWFFYCPSLWNDEAALANNVIKYDEAKIVVTPLDDLQAAPPGYLLVEKLSGRLGDYSEMSLRIVSFGCGLAALFLFACLTGDVLSGWGRVFATTLFSLGGPLIYHTGEGKQYEMEVLASVLLLWMGVRVLKRGIGPLGVCLMGIIGALCVVSANSAIFILAGVFGVLAVNFVAKKQLREAASTGLVLLVAGGVFLLYYVFILHRNPNVAELKASWADHFAPVPVSVGGLVWYMRTGFFALGNPLGLSFDLDFPFLPHSAAAKYLLSLAWPALPLIGLGAATFWRKDRWVGALVLSGWLVTFGASLLHQYPINERLILFLAPSCYLAMGAALSWVDEGHGPRSRLSVAVTGLAGWLMLYVIVNFSVKLAAPRRFAGDEKYSQMREAIDFIGQKKQKDDVVFVMWSAEKFYRYYNYRDKLDWNVIIGLDPRENAHAEEDIKAEISRQVREGTTGRGRAWFLVQDIMSQVSYRDDKGIKHETLTPTGTVYENVLLDRATGKIGATYTGHAAAAILIENNP